MPIRSQHSLQPTDRARVWLTASVFGIAAALGVYCFAGGVGWLMVRLAAAASGDPVVSTGLWSEPQWLVGTTLFGVVVAVGTGLHRFGPRQRWATTALAVGGYLAPSAAAAVASQGASAALSWTIVGAFLLYLNGWVAAAVAFTASTLSSRFVAPSTPSAMQPAAQAEA